MKAKCLLTPSWSYAILEGKDYEILKVKKNGKVVLKADEKGLKSTWDNKFFDLGQLFYCHKCQCIDCQDQRSLL